MDLLSEKRAIVTGGTRGIGFAIATAFAEQGASVVEIWGIDASKGEQAVSSIKKNEGQNIIFRSVDVSDLESVKNAITTFFDSFGRIDILVNNAGITRDKLLMRLLPEDWDRVISTNLTSIYNTCSVAVPLMLKSKNAGSIINISSIVGLGGSPGQTNYAASKAGMIGFSKSLAKEVGSRGIRVNCIAPGFIETAMTAVLSDNLKTEWIKQVPLKRSGKPKDIADAAVFLASDMSSYITAQVLVVDGGIVPF